MTTRQAILAALLIAVTLPLCCAQQPGDLTWMLAYRDKGENALASDNRFPAFLKEALPAFSLPDWGWGGNVNETAPEFLNGVPGLLEVRGGRYLSASGCPPHACVARAMIWVDTKSDIVVFVATDDETENTTRDTETQYHIASAKLYLASKSSLDAAHLPDELRVSILRWLHLEGVLRLNNVVLVTPSGPQPLTTDQLGWTGRLGIDIL